jgi:hypothetical protein
MGSSLKIEHFQVKFSESTEEPEPLGRISKSLNLGRGYAEHWERYSCRELVQVSVSPRVRFRFMLIKCIFFQNWFDACVEQCGGERHMVEVVTSSAPACGLGLGAQGIIYLALCRSMFAGYLADYEVGPVVCSDSVSFSP